MLHHGECVGSIVRSPLVYAAQLTHSRSLGLHRLVLVLEKVLLKAAEK